MDEILVSHVLEHLSSWESAVVEFHRVLKPGGILTVRVPYGVTYIPYHVRFFMPDTLDIFIGARPHDGCCQHSSDRPLFRLEKKEVLRSFWFGWHLKRYLGISFLSERHYRFPLGRKIEIVWRLAKVRST